MQVIVSRANKALVLPPEPAALSLFPGAPQLQGSGNIIVPHGIRETLIMRHLGVEVPNPMLAYYDWVGGKPYAVQRATCKLLTEHPRAYVLNDLGTGKTKTVLWAWDYLHKCGLAKKLLVVAPLSTLNFVWAREIFATLPHCKCVVLHGTRQERLDRLATDADIYVVNHDGLKVIGEALQARADIDTIAIDELAAYRNNSERSKYMRKFAARFTYAWGMTGKPMPHEPVDVWGQCMILTPHTVPKYRQRCKEILMAKQSTYVWTAKPDAVERAFKMMQPSVRYTLSDVTELPSMSYRDMDVGMSTEQAKVYKKVAGTMQAMIKDRQITAVNAGAALNKLLQIAGGWVYTKNPEFVRLDPTPRVVALADILADAAEKVLVAIPYRHMIEGISKILNMKGVDIDHCVVHGDTKDRDTLFNLFQNTNKYDVMLVHPQCVAHGLTLTRATTIVWYVPTTSLEIYDQFNARIRRIGQQFRQQVIHLFGTPVEKKVYRMLRQKQRMQQLFLTLVEESTADAV